MCGEARWIHRSDARRGKTSGLLCRPCSILKSWDGRRIDLSDNRKHCTDCGQYKLLDDFSTDNRKRANKRSYCKICAAKRARKYRRENQKVYRANKRIEKARRRAWEHSARGDFSIDDWQTILTRYGSKCLRCGALRDLQPDHVVPLSLGGPHSLDNIQPLCGRCNREKQATVADYR